MTVAAAVAPTAARAQHAAAYQGSPLARTILGPERNIKTIGVAELKHYIATHYRSVGLRLCFVRATQS